MAISEEDRHHMYLKFEEVLRAQVAHTVMEHLPPAGWADVATKRDLDAQSALLKQDLEAVRLSLDSKIDTGLARVTADVARANAEILDRLRTQTLVMCSTLIAGMGVVAALARG